MVEESSKSSKHPMRCETCRMLQWDNRLIWSLESLLAWVRANHMDQHDIRDHIDLMLGEYRNELEARQQHSKNNASKYRFEKDGIHIVAEGPEEIISLKEHDAAIARFAIQEHEFCLRQTRDHVLCFYENPDELQKFVQTAREDEREKILKKIDDYINNHAPWLAGTDDRVVDARKLIAFTRSLRSTYPTNVGNGRE